MNTRCLENFQYFTMIEVYILVIASVTGIGAVAPPHNPLDEPPIPDPLLPICGYPGSFVNSRVQIQIPMSPPIDGPIHFSVPVGTTALYSCEEPYISLGETRRICRPDGTWSGAIPFCGK